MLKNIIKSFFENVITSGMFPDFISCLSEFCKNKKCQKVTGQAIDFFPMVNLKLGEYISSNLKDSEQVNRKSSSMLSPVGGDHDFIEFWMPILFGLHGIIMTSELDIRTKYQFMINFRALQHMFEILKSRGKSFNRDSWDLLSKGVLFSIFDDLKHTSNSNNHQNSNSKFVNKDDMTVWVSTTLIQALGQLVDLLSLYYTTLSFLLDELLSLIKLCITHENETLSRIGCTCLQKLINKNCINYLDDDWKRLAKFFSNLFEESMPYFLIFKYEGADSEFMSQIKMLSHTIGPPPERKEFQKQVPKCALLSVAVQALQDVLSCGPEDVVFKSMPAKYLFLIMDCFQKSYQFSSVFNCSLGLRNALHKGGYMAQVPNLLTIETNSAEFYLTLLMKIYTGKHPSQKEYYLEAEKRLFPYILNIKY